MEEKMLDINFCLQKEAEYKAKACAVSDPKLKDAYKAAAREFAHRVQQLRRKNEKPH